MAVNRRSFLKAAGLTAVGGLAGKGAVDALASSEAPASSSSGTKKGEKVKRWAMAVDLRKCKSKEGCTDCAAACRSAHNVPVFESKKDEIKWIWNEKYEHAFPDQHNDYLADDIKKSPIPVLCNHCDNPPCTRVCPTQSTFKREDGVVVMDWHRCIGCRYCVAACPYGSRSFNWRDPRPHIEKINTKFPTRMRGVVEKCTFCDEIIAKNPENPKPHCVAACKENALIFGDLENPESEIRKVLGEKFSIRRKPGLGTKPEVYYIV